MKTTIIIRSEEHRQRALNLIRLAPLEPLLEVTVKEHKKDISAGQRALYWQWLTVIGSYLGESKETLHERYKDRFLTIIYERDNPEYAEMISSLREVYRQGMKEAALSLRKQVVCLTSITTATVAQMSEYMNDIEMDASSMAIQLPHPDDAE